MKRYAKRQHDVPTPAVLEETIWDYLEAVTVANQPTEVIYDKVTGRAYDSVTQAEKDGVVDIKIKREDVPIYDKIVPTINGFYAFTGISKARLSKRMTKDGDERWEEFEAVWDWFVTMLESDIEQLLLNPLNRNAQGAKFVAVNAYGWSDKSEVEHSGDTGVTFNMDLPISIDK